jgi:crotonobetainyl-CoA:carnitine CoA-transferase CaiB-like acyl-CoA transferase
MSDPALAEALATAANSGGGDVRALGDVRIADLTIITAGASATQILADYGADVVKVESGAWLDPFRTWDSGADFMESLTEPWNQSPPFQCVNRNKRSLALDLKAVAGREMFLRLVERSDVVTENFRDGVMDRLGLGFDALRAANPRIVVVSLSSQGTTGPERGYGSFGSTLDALSGLMSITGYDAKTPIWSTNEINYPDQVASIFGAAMVLLGLRQRDATGEAVRVDVSQRELVTSMIGEAVLDYTVNGHVQTPQGNRDFSMAPHGVYPCRGEDEWLTITVQTDEQWRRLAQLIGGAALALDARYTTFRARWDQLDALDALVAAWTAKHDRLWLMEGLQAEGVPAAALLTGPELWADANLSARGFYTEVENQLSGPQTQRRWPFRLRRTPASIRQPAPRLGQDTDGVLSAVLGLNADEIGQLRGEGVLNTEPGLRPAQHPATDTTKKVAR